MPPVLAAAELAAAFEAPLSASPPLLACESCVAVAAVVCDAAAPLPLAEVAFAALLLLDVPDVEAFVELPAEDCEPRSKFFCFFW